MHCAVVNARRSQMQRMVREGAQRRRREIYNRVERDEVRGGGVDAGGAVGERGASLGSPHDDTGPDGSASDASRAAGSDPDPVRGTAGDGFPVEPPGSAAGEKHGVEHSDVRGDSGAAPPEELLGEGEEGPAERRPWLGGSEQWWHPAASEHPYTTLGLDLLEAAAAAESRERAGELPPDAPAVGPGGSPETLEEEEEAFSNASRSYAHRRATSAGPAAAYDEGLTLLLLASRAGDATAMFAVAMRVLVGSADEEGLAVDRAPPSRVALPTALDLLRGAAALGHADAGALLALLADAGWGLSGVDALHPTAPPPRVLAALEQAAERGSDVARYALGTRLLYAFGGAARACDLAVHHIMPLAEAAIEAAQGGDAPPPSSVRQRGLASGGKGGGLPLSRLLRPHSHTHSHPSSPPHPLCCLQVRPLSHVFEDAAGVDAGGSEPGAAVQARLEAEEAAAEEGDPVAALRAGDVHLFGDAAAGVPANPDRALRHYQAAAEAGDPAAYMQLGTMYLNGLGVDQDNATALQHFQAAADAGDVAALNGLGVMHMRGAGVPQNDTRALELFEEAAVQGHAEAAANAGLMYMQGLGCDRNSSRAREFYEQGAEGGQPTAQFNLGVFLLNGEGGPANCTRGAETWLSLIDASTWMGGLAFSAARAQRLHARRDPRTFAAFALAAAMGHNIAQLSAAFLLEHDELAPPVLGEEVTAAGEGGHPSPPPASTGAGDLRAEARGIAWPLLHGAGEAPPEPSAGAASAHAEPGTEGERDSGRSPRQALLRGLLVAVGDLMGDAWLIAPLAPYVARWVDSLAQRRGSAHPASSSSPPPPLQEVLSPGVAAAAEAPSPVTDLFRIPASDSGGSDSDSGSDNPVPLYSRRGWRRVVPEPARGQPRKPAAAPRSRRAREAHLRRALGWYGESSRQGTGEGARKLGDCASGAWGANVCGAPNLSAAAAHYRLSADRANGQGAYTLARMHACGVGDAPKNWTQATQLMEDVEAYDGLGTACALLGHLQLGAQWLAEEYLLPALPQGLQRAAARWNWGWGVTPPPRSDPAYGWVLSTGHAVLVGALVGAACVAAALS